MILKRRISYIEGIPMKEMKYEFDIQSKDMFLGRLKINYYKRQVFLDEKKLH